MFNWLKKKTPAKVESGPDRAGSFFSTHANDGLEPAIKAADRIEAIVRTLPRVAATGAQDDSSNGVPDLKINGNGANVLSEVLAAWYLSQGFIGHQLCAIIAQNWLVNKACAMPGRDAIRNGYDIVTADGDELDEDALKILKYYDKRFNVRKNMEEFVKFGRIFGIRIALFKVDSTDPEYYEKPFNPDGITPGSYKGIVQVDPYWCGPVLDQISAAHPDSMHFYEPTWWIINGKRYHRSHLIIFRNAEPADILKPQYIYGGVPVPQQIMERVYAAERVANEAPMLAQTKRTNVWLTDMERFATQADLGISKLQEWSYYRDNFGVKLGDKEGDEFQQFDTSLGDLDEVIMTQYQIVAAASNVPSTKLLGTTPKGFNATGDYEESSYHEELESIQTHDLTPLLERHHLLVMRAYVMPKLKINHIETQVSWVPLDSPTSKEVADTNLVKAQAGQVLIAAGVISSDDERKRIATDPDSGYHSLGIEDELNLNDDDED